MTDKDTRLIEDYLPIEAISLEASREKNVRKGHISTLHLWWARRPLVACRAAVYGALVPAAKFVPNGASDGKRKSLGRANASRFVKSLCQYPGAPQVIKEAQKHILTAHAQRLNRELAEAAGRGHRAAWAAEFNFESDHVTVEDVINGHAPRPRVADMFAGGGAIPLEALRLGCEAHALDLNPVAYIIELCTLVYPQKYGQPDASARGMTGPKNRDDETTWGGLSAEVGYWGNWVLKKVQAEISDLYPLIPDPEFKGHRKKIQSDWLETHDTENIPQGYLMPVAYLWTRTVRCKNPSCGARVPLVRHTWLCTKENRYVAMKVLAPKGQKTVRFEVVEARSEKGLGFDPEGFSKGGNATCPFCGTVADIKHVKDEGWSGRMGAQPMALVAVREGERGKVYLDPSVHPESFPDSKELSERISNTSTKYSITLPSEPIASQPSDSKQNTLGITVRPYGLREFRNLFNKRQLLSLLTFASALKYVDECATQAGMDAEYTKSVLTYLACVVDKLADFNSSLCVLKPGGGRGIVHTFGRQVITMVWDYAEANPFNAEIACWESSLKEVVNNLKVFAETAPASVTRASATELPWATGYFDAVITDPPYYDNVPYADISDFFYVWLKRTVGRLFPEHFAGETTPKRQEAVANSARFAGDFDKAKAFYESMMAKAFIEAYRVLKPEGNLTIVYAHKTTLGWSTLVEALRKAGFMIAEAWPLDTETTGRLRAHDSATLASSIFLVARKREETKVGNYQDQVRPELEEIVRERVETLWDMGVSGADLVIACVGAGLRAFTRFGSVEYPNGEAVPAERFLTEVETVVLEAILARLSKEVGRNGAHTSLAGLDAPTRFYILWRYTYRTADLDAGEAIIFANGTHVELEGADGLSTGALALVEKKKGKYRLRDFADRGGQRDLGMSNNGNSAPLIDALQRTLWLMENRPLELPDFLRDAQLNREQMRLVAQALAGPALKGGELDDVSPTGELAALAKLTANWRSVIEDATVTITERAARRAGQGTLFGKGDNR